jgi:rRNA biogenesis protein RRP5
LVLSVDTEKKRISFGLKPSYFFDEDLQDESQETADEAEESDDEMAHEADQRDDEMQESDDEDSVDEEVSLEAPNFRDKSSFHPKILVVPGMQNTTTGASGPEESEAVPTLSLTAPLRWDNNAQATGTAETASETSDDEADEPARKKRKRKHEIQHDLTVNIQRRAPQSSIDFERLLLSSPNSSYLWLQFMAFQLQLSEIEKAREIGRRALKAINFREEQERLNVWIALLNLETSYGTEASLDAVFKEAARANDSKTIHWRLAVLLDESQKHEVRVALS